MAPINSTLEWLDVGAEGLVGAAVLLVGITLGLVAMRGVLVLLRHPSTRPRRRRRRPAPPAPAAEP